MNEVEHFTHSGLPFVFSKGWTRFCSIRLQNITDIDLFDQSILLFLNTYITIRVYLIYKLGLVSYNSI